jgi:hypothetical protein
MGGGQTRAVVCGMGWTADRDLLEDLICPLIRAG